MDSAFSPQNEHVFDVFRAETFENSSPYYVALYAAWRLKSYQLASGIISQLAAVSEEQSSIGGETA